MTTPNKPQSPTNGEEKMREDFAEWYLAPEREDRSVPTIADWWLEKVAQARQEEQQQIEGRVKEYIEDYFKGLILIPNPQATKERLLLLLPEIISGNVKK